MSDESFKILGRAIGQSHPPYVVAELSANHNGELETALQLIEEAKIAGADAVKIQTYRPDTITIESDRPEFRIESGPWRGLTLYELYEAAHTPWEWHAALFAKARDVAITLFSSPFDHTAVDFLEQLEAPAYKIASFEANDLPLIARVSATGKPLIISTGMATEREIGDAIDCARDHGANDIAILHCVSAYPAAAADYNLKTIPDMMRRFGLPVGISDHTVGNATAVAAVALGACLVEKHVTLDRSAGGFDDSFSIEPAELAALCKDTRIAWDAVGSVHYGRTGGESDNAALRRSLYVVKDVEVGEIFTEDNIRSIRPGYGLPPKELPTVLGKRAKRRLSQGTPLERSHVGD